MYHVGRVDYWLASNPGDLAQYALLIDGVSYGLYAGGRQIFDLNGLAQKATQGTDQNTTAIVLFNTGRFASAEYRDMAIRLAQRMAGAVISEAPGVFILLIR
jgi:hypothetical protein